MYIKPELVPMTIMSIDCSALCVAWRKFDMLLQAIFS